jgi:hypothetical protein
MDEGHFCAFYVFLGAYCPPSVPPSETENPSMRLLKRLLTPPERWGHRSVLLATGFVITAVCVGLGTWALTRSDEPIAATIKSTASPLSTPATDVPRSSPTPASSAGDRPRISPKRNSSGPAATPKPARTTVVVVATPPTTKPKPTATAVPDVTGPGLIRNLGTGMCMDLPGGGPVADGTVLTQSECRPAIPDNQVYEKISRGQQFLLQNVRSQFCIDLHGNEAVGAGSEILVHTCVIGGSDNLMYRQKVIGRGFRLINVKSDLCLAAPADGGPDSKLTLSACTAAPTRLWTFTPEQ